MKKYKLSEQFAVGAVHQSNNYGEYEVVEYLNSEFVGIEFLETGYRTYATAYTLKNGSVRDKMAKKR